MKPDFGRLEAGFFPGHLQVFEFGDGVLVSSEERGRRFPLGRQEIDLVVVVELRQRLLKRLLQKGLPGCEQRIEALLLLGIRRVQTLISRQFVIALRQQLMQAHDLGFCRLTGADQLLDLA